MLKKLKNAITDKTRAILAVNLLGNPNDFEKILAITASKKYYSSRGQLRVNGCSI